MTDNVNAARRRSMPQLDGRCARLLVPLTACLFFRFRGWG